MEDVKTRAIPRAAYWGPLDLAGVEIDAYVLEDGRRVISSRGMVKSLTGGGGAKDGKIGRLLERIPDKYRCFGVGPKIEFETHENNLGLGYPAEFLADVCGAYVDAMICGDIHPKQIHVAQRAWQIQKAFAKTGITALVDDATGYTKDRPRDELARKFAEYLLPVPGKWQPTYPESFFRNLARLYRCELRDRTRRPQWMGAFIQRWVYEAIDQDVADELKRREPHPSHGFNRHQHLSERARSVLQAHLTRLGTVMRLSAGPTDFQSRFATEFRGAPLQLPLGVMTRPHSN